MAPKKSQDSKDNESLDISTISFATEEFIRSSIIASELLLKTYFDTRMKAYTDAIYKNIQECVDEKYNSIHDNKYMTPNLLTKQTVETIIESLFQEKIIKAAADKYMPELSQLRFL
jgi:hypothetical protein